MLHGSHKKYFGAEQILIAFLSLACLQLDVKFSAATFAQKISGAATSSLRSDWRFIF